MKKQKKLSVGSNDNQLPNSANQNVNAGLIKLGRVIIKLLSLAALLLIIFNKIISQFPELELQGWLMIVGVFVFWIVLGLFISTILHKAVGMDEQKAEWIGVIVVGLLILCILAYLK